MKFLYEREVEHQGIKYLVKEYITPKGHLFGEWEVIGGI